jgi:hypothetical protein
VDTATPVDTNLFSPGDVWSFTVSDHLVIDDFGTYSDSEFLQDSWKCPDVSAVHLEAAGSQQTACFRGCEGDSIAIKWNAAHHITGAGIPRVIFPKREQPARS